MTLGIALGVGIAPFESGFPARLRFLSFAPGQALPGETFARAGATATYFDVNGVLQTAAANQKRDAHYIAGVRTLLMEGARTNIVVSPRDLTNAAWVHTTMTPVKDQVGIDGVAASASSILATGANATSLQTIVSASATRSQQCWVKRLVGVGAVSMTMDNVTFTAIAVTGAWTKVTIPTQAALVNPVVGFKLAISGDKIAVDYVDNETGPFSSSPKVGARNVDIYSLPFAAQPAEMAVYAKFVELGTAQVLNQRVFEISDAANATPRFYSKAEPTVLSARHDPAGATVATGAAGPAFGDTVEMIAQLFADGGCNYKQSLNGAAETNFGHSAAQALAAAWSAQLLWVASQGNGVSPGFAAFQSIKVLAGIRTFAEMQAA